MPKYFKDLKDTEFFNFQAHLVSQAATNAVAWGIPAGAITDLTAAKTAYEPKYNAITNVQTRTPAQVQNHREGREQYEDLIEEFANSYIIYNTVISNAEVGSLGFNRKSDQPGTRPVIAEGVFGKMEPMGGAKVQFISRTASDSTRASLHEAADAVEVKYAIGDAPANVDACPYKEISTKARFAVQVTAADAGKKIHAYLRWRNNVNPEKSGPWSTKLEAIIV